MDPAHASFRYGSALALTLVLRLFLIAAPSTHWAQGVTLAIEGAHWSWSP